MNEIDLQKDELNGDEEKNTRAKVFVSEYTDKKRKVAKLADEIITKETIICNLDSELIHAFEAIATGSRVVVCPTEGHEIEVNYESKIIDWIYPGQQYAGLKISSYTPGLMVLEDAEDHYVVLEQVNFLTNWEIVEINEPLLT